MELKLPEADLTLLKHVIDYRRWLKQAEDNFSEDMLRRMDLKVGDIVEHMTMGFRYEIVSARVSYGLTGVQSIVFGRRVWTTGKRAGTRAASETALGWINSYKKVAS